MALFKCFYLYQVLYTVVQELYLLQNGHGYNKMLFKFDVLKINISLKRYVWLLMCRNGPSRVSLA